MNERERLELKMAIERVLWEMPDSDAKTFDRDALYDAGEHLREVYDAVKERL